VEHYCDAYIEEMRKGNAPGGQMSKWGWSNLQTSYYESSGLMHNKEQVTGKLRNLKKIWRFCKAAYSSTGLAIDADRMIQAGEEWWAKHAGKVHVAMLPYVC
jgi:hypothetical protein